MLRIVEADIDEANNELRELEQSLQAAKDQQKVIQNRHKELISDQKQAEKDKQKLEASKIKVAQRRFAGSSHGPNKWDAANKEFGIILHEPHWFHRGAANFLLITMWFWVLYRIRDDKGKMLGWHKPWLEKHDDHYEWITVGMAPVFKYRSGGDGEEEELEE